MPSAAAAASCPLASSCTTPAGTGGHCPISVARRTTMCCMPRGTRVPLWLKAKASPAVVPLAQWQAGATARWLQRVLLCATRICGTPYQRHCETCTFSAAGQHRRPAWPRLAAARARLPAATLLPAALCHQAAVRWLPSAKVLQHSFGTFARRFLLLQADRATREVADQTVRPSIGKQQWTRGTAYNINASFNGTRRLSLQSWGHRKAPAVTGQLRWFSACLQNCTTLPGPSLGSCTALFLLQWANLGLGTGPTVVALD